MQTPRTEFAQALRAISTERKLDADVILGTIKQAIVAAYRRDAREQGADTEGLEYDVDLDSKTGEARIYAWPEEKPDERKDVTPPGFGRIAAQTAKQVIHQKIREAEKDAILDEFTGRVGSLISGMILRFDGPDVRVDIGRSEAIMPASERVPDERLTPNQRLTFLLKEITETPRGKRIILSRSDNEFVKKLFEREVPEMSSGSVEIKAISREPGIRSKIAVSSTQSGIDPVGSCVGQKGVRVQSVTNELGGERVDIIPWSADASDFIKASLSPAEELTVTLNEDEELAVVKAPEDQLSLAIGRDGQNARLASKLTGWKIEIKSLEGDEPKDEGQVQETEEGTEEKPTEKTGAGEKEEKDEQEPEGQMEEAEKKEDATKTSDPKSSSGDGKKQDETGESEGEKEEEVSKDQADEKVAESDS